MKALRDDGNTTNMVFAKLWLDEHIFVHLITIRLQWLLLR